MILSGFKRKNVIKRTASELHKPKKQSEKSNVRVQNIVVLIEESNSENICEKLSKCLSVQKSEIQLISFVEKANGQKDMQYILTAKDFGLFGKLKNKKIREMLIPRTDLLVNYVRNNPYLNSLVVQSNAKFKAGLFSQNQVNYDLTIAIENCNEEGFNNELMKYLKILNKI